MKEAKVQIFLDLSFMANEKLENRIRKAIKRPFRFDGSGQYLGKKPQRDLTFSANVVLGKASQLRKVAYALRRWEGVKSVAFSIVEQIPRKRRRPIAQARQLVQAHKRTSRQRQ